MVELRDRTTFSNHLWRVSEALLHKDLVESNPMPSPGCQRYVATVGSVVGSVNVFISSYPSP